MLRMLSEICGAAFALSLVAFVAFLGVMAGGDPALGGTNKYPVPSGVVDSGEIVVGVDDGNIQGTDTPTIGTSITIGSSGTALTQAVVYSVTVPETAISALGSIEIEVAVSGVTTADKLFAMAPGDPLPAGSRFVVLVGVRPSDGNGAIILTFANLSDAAQSATGGTYTVMAWRS